MNDPRQPLPGGTVRPTLVPSNSPMPICSNRSDQAARQSWTRQSAITGKGPVRACTFYTKISDQGMEYFNDAINHFIDQHPEVDVKFVTTNIGTFDGKFKDLALIVNVWY